MRSKAELPLDTIALRQTIIVAVVSFVLGFIAVCVGVLWLQHAAAPDRFWTWELFFHVLQSLHLGFFGGLGLCAGCCAVLSRCHFKRGYHRCVHCGRPLAGVGKWCTCPTMRELVHQAERSGAAETRLRSDRHETLHAPCDTFL